MTQHPRLPTRHARPHAAFVLAVAFSSWGCGGSQPSADAGADAAAADVGIDGGHMDLGTPVDGATDADAGDTADSGVTVDAGDADEGVDAGPTDMGPPDAGVRCQTTGYCYMFVTGPVDGSAFGPAGAAGLDALCNADASRPSPTSTYLALVADGTTRVACTTDGCSGGGAQENVGWVLKPSREYRQVDGTTVIGTTNERGVFDFPLDAPVSTTIVGTNATRTGLLTTWVSSSSNCSGWTTSAGNSQLGLHDQTSSLLLDIGTSGCTNSARIVCVEQ